MITAIISAIGSANKTANNLSSKKFGRINISGINKTNFLSKARNSEAFACPKAKNDCWQAICAPNINIPTK